MDSLSGESTLLSSDIYLLDFGKKYSVGDGSKDHNLTGSFKWE